MTTTYHTPITIGAAGNSSIVNASLAQLDTGIGVAYAHGDDALSIATANLAEIAAARSPYASLDARLDAFVVAGGNIATKTNGVSAAGQKVITVDATDGFIVGSYVTYYLNGTTLEGNVIGSIQAGVSLTMVTNVGASPAGGVLDDTYISMISLSEYLAAQAIPHAGTLLLPNTMAYANGDVYHVDAYGAVGDGTADDTAAFAAVLTAIRARDAGKVKSAVLKLTPGANYLITNSLNLTDIADVTIDGGTSETRITYADADATTAKRVLFDCLGSARLTFRDFTVWGDSTNVPAVFFSFGRSTDANGEDSGQNKVQNVHCRGYWTVAAFYNVASELMHLSDVWVLTSGPTGCKYAVFASGTNDESVGSEYATRSATVSMACVWVNNFNIGSGATPTAYIPFKFGPEAGNITIRDGYAYTYDSQPIIQTTGNTYNLVVENLLCEGAPDNSIHFTAYSGAGTIRNVTLIGVALGNYAALGIKQDAGTIIQSLAIINCQGNTVANASSMSFLGEVNDSYIGRWWTTAGSGTVTLNKFYNSRLHLAGQTLALTDGLGSEIHNDVSGGDHYRHLQTGLRVGTVGATNLAEINEIRTASDTWSPGAISDDAQASTYVPVSGVTQADAWFCTAHYAGIDGVSGWDLSAVAYDGGVGVSIVNRSGGSLTPTGTLHVMAMKVTAT